MELDRDFLQDLEFSLNTIHPEDGDIAIEILGYGEISLVFTIPDDGAGDVAYKRLPIFSSQEQVEQHIEAYERYHQYLTDVGIRVPAYGAAWVYADEKQAKISLYCAQETAPPDRIGNRLLHTLEDDEILELVARILDEMTKIWRFNTEHDNIQLGFDGQISNFAYIDDELLYLDTSTPMYRIDGEDAMEGELFLKSAPPGIRFFLKLFFLQEVLDRYYDFRSVTIDLLANFYKEQREDLIPQLIELTNSFIEKLPEKFEFGEKITEKEVKDYYKSDKFIWVLFQKVRSLHRFITTKILRRKYPFYLPEKIER